MRTLSQRICSVTIVISFILMSAFFALNSRADEIYTFVIKKQEEKAKSRWSLAEWLDTRDRMRMMDLWLALHSPSPYEFFVAGAYSSGDDGALGRYRGWDVSAAAYASIFGLGFEKQLHDGVAETAGLFDLRVFGFYVQGTNITLQAGLRNQDRAEGRFRSALAGISSTIYLAKNFGIEGLFRHYFDSVPSESGFTLSGNRYEGGAFIDFRFLRVFGKFVSTPVTLAQGGASFGVQNTGVEAGLKFFF